MTRKESELGKESDNSAWQTLTIIFKANQVTKLLEKWYVNK